MRRLFSLVFILAAIASKSQTVCAGSTLALSAPNPSNLTNATYSIAGNAASSSTSNIFIISPTVTTTFTLVTSGNLPSPPNTYTSTTAVNVVTVFAQPQTAPTLTQATCTNSNNAVNLNLTFFGGGPAPAYTVAFPVSNTPNGWTGVTTTSLAGAIGAGPYSATITTTNGCSTISNFTITAQPLPANFVLVPAAQVYSVTCNQPTVTIAGSQPAYTYTFTNSGSSAPITNTEVSVTYTDVGSWTVTATNPTSGCTRSQTFAVGVNTVAPVATVNPSFQTITCGPGSAIQTVTITALSPTFNINHVITPPQGFTSYGNNAVLPYQPGGTGTYTHCLTNAITGCSSCRTFTVSSTQGFPTYSVSSLQMTSIGTVSLGCAPTKSAAVLSYTNTNTTPPGGGLTYTLLAPGSSSATTFPLGGVSVFTVTSPGTYTAVAQDLANQCETRIQVAVVNNTFSPVVDSVNVSRTILDCYVSESVMKGFGHSVADTNGTVTYVWSFPGTPGSFGAQQYTAAINPSVSVTQTLNNNYTLTITDNNNTCISRTVIPIYQNLFPPVAKITGASSLTCVTPTILLSNASSHNPSTPAIFPTNSLVVASLWEGPTPQLPLQNKSSYVAEQPGTYTLTAQDLNNGCKSTTTIVVPDNKVYPILASPAPAATLDCGSTATKLSPTITSGNSNLSYSWTPSPTIAPTPSVTGDNTPTLTANVPGKYYVVVTNTVNGCASRDSMYVVSGNLSTKIEAGPHFGYAPLTVSLTNNSSSSLGNNSITTVWDFGNGTTSVTPSASVLPVTVYNLPGTYTVLAWVSKGQCLDSVYTVVNVEVPSEVKVPNVFTPNGDNVNDLFFVKMANLSEVSFTVFDRWGHEVYQLTTNGNVAWDGKNKAGGDASEGTYFYIITAKGKDGKDYDMKGTISLFR